jgi:hypothetical protein
MNAREQYLQKRVERLEALIAFLRADLDYTESVGAAFAFDLGQAMWRWSDYDPDAPENPTPRGLEFSWAVDMWDDAVKEALREDRG